MYLWKFLALYRVLIQVPKTPEATLLLTCQTPDPEATLLLTFQTPDEPLLAGRCMGSESWSDQIEWALWCTWQISSISQFYWVRKQAMFHITIHVCQYYRQKFWKVKVFSVIVFSVSVYDTHCRLTLVLPVTKGVAPDIFPVQNQGVQGMQCHHPSLSRPLQQNWGVGWGWDHISSYYQWPLQGNQNNAPAISTV